MEARAEIYEKGTEFAVEMMTSGLAKGRNASRQSSSATSLPQNILNGLCQHGGRSSLPSYYSSTRGLGSPVISSKKRKMKGFAPRLMDQEMNERLEDPAQGEKSQWDAFAERNRDTAVTKVLTWEADLDLKRSVTIIQKEKDRTKEDRTTYSLVEPDFATHLHPKKKETARKQFFLNGDTASPVISSKKRKMKGFAPRLMDQEMNERLEDPAQGEKSQWDAFAERNRDAAATKEKKEVAWKGGAMEVERFLISKFRIKMDLISSLLFALQNFSFYLSSEFKIWQLLMEFLPSFLK
nr:hypothetical protein [Tanacetum cinerariifolium]